MFILLNYHLPHRPRRYRFVYLCHQPDGFLQRHHNFLVVVQVIIGQRPAFAVFEPLLGNLVATDMELPDLQRNAIKILCFVDVDTLVIVIMVTFSTSLEPETGYFLT